MAAARKPAANMDAIGMLVADHKKVQKAFKDFEKLKKAAASAANPTSSGKLAPI